MLFLLQKMFSNSLSLLKACEEGFGMKDTNLNEFNNSLSSPLGVHDKVVPNEVINFGFMSLALVKYLLV